LAAPTGGPKPPTGPEPRALDSVLVAEDDPIFRLVLSNWLRKWSYRVVAVNNGLDAWTILQQKDAPQMAILDWVMPGIDGLEVCRRLRSHESGLYRYILLVTVKDHKQDVVEGLEAGADDYVTKPFDMAELRARIRAGERILQLQDALIRAHAALQFEAAHDPLTGVWNRNAILELLQRETQRHQRSGGPMGLMMVDVDHFKSVNDAHGHLVGDSVLRELAHRLAVSVRSYDLVGRYGGEEFLIVLPGCSSADLAATAERARAGIAHSPVQINAGPIAVTASVGIVSAFLGRHPPFDYETLLSAADEALYIAKAKGRNRVERVLSSVAVLQGDDG
jgi:two-component system cell cycle response regulator